MDFGKPKAKPSIPRHYYHYVCALDQEPRCNMDIHVDGRKKGEFMCPDHIAALVDKGDTEIEVLTPELATPATTKETTAARDLFDGKQPASSHSQPSEAINETTVETGPAKQCQPLQPQSPNPREEMDITPDHGAAQKQDKLPLVAPTTIQTQKSPATSSPSLEHQMDSDTATLINGLQRVTSDWYTHPLVN